MAGGACHLAGDLSGEGLIGIKVDSGCRRGKVFLIRVDGIAPIDHNLDVAVLTVGF